MLAEIQQVLPFIFPMCQEFSKVEDTLTETVVKMENVERMMRLSGAEAGQDEESLHSLDLANSIPSPEIIKQSRRVNRRVTLNVGGVRHEALWKVLELLPRSRLGLLSKSETHEEIMSLCSDYNLIE